jgi:predicted PurR-regulated permease PerM
VTDSSPPLHDDRFLARAVEVSVRIGVVLLLATWCFQITRPFLIPIVWGVIIATAVHPGYQRLQAGMGGRRKLAAALLTLLALSLLIVPTVLFAGSLVESGQWLASGLADGTLEVPPPPETIASWPLIGEPLHGFWQLAYVNFEAFLRKVGPHLIGLGSGLLSTAAGLGLGIVQFVVSIAISGVLLAGADSGHRVAKEVANRLAGERGDELTDLAGATVRGVAQGILGVALIQSTLIGLGLFAAGVPHAALWTLLCLMLAVIQLPPFLVVLPIIAYVFTTSSTGVAIVFTIWQVLAGGSDNVLKPLLLARGSDVPMIVIFMGAIGGFMMSGFIGLFVGAVVLSLGYELFMAWLSEGDRPGDAERETVPAGETEGAA